MRGQKPFDQDGCNFSRIRWFGQRCLDDDITQEPVFEGFLCGFPRSSLPFPDEFRMENGLDHQVSGADRG
jgi:hypothetical protein